VSHHLWEQRFVLCLARLVTLAAMMIHSSYRYQCGRLAVVERMY
jgi:hypothetical protein